VGGDSVEVLRVLHTATDWPRLTGDDLSRKWTLEELESEADLKPNAVND
jgi:hypothetical protein